MDEIERLMMSLVGAAVAYGHGSSVATATVSDAARAELRAAIRALRASPPPRDTAEALERAALEADAEAALYRKSADRNDAAGAPASASSDIHGALACDAVAKRIRALSAPPSSPSAADPDHNATKED